MTETVTEQAPAQTEGAAPAAARKAPRGGLGWQRFMRIAFHVVAIVEAITWTGLLYGMWMRYIVGVGEEADPVPLWGMLHGIAFIVFCGVVVVAAWTFRWKIWEFLVAIVAAVPPLTTIPLEIWYSKTGRVKPRG